MAQVRRITRTDPLYEQECALREDVLLGPIGYDIARFVKEFAGFEERFEHFVAVTHRAGGGTLARSHLDQALLRSPDQQPSSSATLGGRDADGGGPCVIGCAALLPNYPEAGIGKLMQMAVDRQRQGEGIGRRLVVAVESRAFGELGLRELFCHAQLPAVGFYETLGWEIDSEEFMEAGIAHRRMVLRAPDDLGGPGGDAFGDEVGASGPEASGG